MHMKTITLVAVLLSAGAVWSGNASDNVQAATPLVPVNLVTAQPPVAMVLHTIIIYNSPGSWKREALWDEYVVTLSNQGTQPLTVASASLADSSGTSYAASASMRALGKESTILEQRCFDAGLAFARAAEPAAVTVGGGIRLIGATGGVTDASASLAVGAAVVPVPAFYTRKIVSLSKQYFADEFKQRCLALPMTLAPGEARAGSLFFPMVPNPRALNLHWSNGIASGELALPLDSVHGLHVQAPAPAVAPPHP